MYYKAFIIQFYNMIEKSSPFIKYFADLPGIDCTKNLPEPKGITVNPFPNTLSFFIARSKSSWDIS